MNNFFEIRVVTKFGKKCYKINSTEMAIKITRKLFSNPASLNNTI